MLIRVQSLQVHLIIRQIHELKLITIFLSDMNLNIYDFIAKFNQIRTYISKDNIVDGQFFENQFVFQHLYLDKNMVGHNNYQVKVANYSS